MAVMLDSLSHAFLLMTGLLGAVSWIAPHVMAAVPLMLRPMCSRYAAQVIERTVRCAYGTV